MENIWWRGDFESNEKAHEILDDWRSLYYQADRNLQISKAAINLHPNQYVVADMINPMTIYDHEIAKSLYEIGLELTRLLDSKPGPTKTGGEDS